MNVELTPFQRSLVLSACPPGTTVHSAQWVRSWLLPCPLRVTVALPGGAEHTRILRLDRDPHGVDMEARILPVLARCGLPVATLLAGPVRDSEQLELGAMSVLTLLPGDTLLDYAWRVPAAHHERIEHLVVEAVLQLHSLTATLAHEPVAHSLPQRSLRRELNTIVADAGAWRNVAAFAEAVEQLGPIVAQTAAPLVFSNGDYNPANFLGDGERVTGFVDFAHACFEDPYVGVAKYVTFDWLPFNTERLLDHFRKHYHVTDQAWALRVAVACLWSFVRRPVEPAAVHDNREAVLQHLHHALHQLRSATINTNDVR